MKIKEIRSTLSNYKIPEKHIAVLDFKKGKNPAKYIKWSYALGIFLKHYPEARWEFVQYEQADGTMIDVQYYKDGSCSVECNVWIGDIKMHMWLPVTKGQSMNPSGNSFDINTTKMRCLTKCISVCFGLGADVYGMDMLQESEGEVEVSSKRISNSEKSTSVQASPTSFIAEPNGAEKPKAKKFDYNQIIDCGYNAGEDYTSYDDDINKVRKDIKYWNSNAKKDHQQKHLTNLKDLEKVLEKKATDSFTNRVA